MEKNLQIAQEVLEKVGGAKNVTGVVHCMTRLRFDLKDKSLVDEKGLKNVKGVLGTTISGGQYQVVIGQNVPKVYKELCKIGGFKVEAEINENLDGAKKKISVKGIFTAVLNYMSGSMTILIPGFMAAAMFKTLAVVLGPDMLKVITAESDLYVLFAFMYNAFFYFMPIMLGYSCAKKLNLNVVIGMFCGAMLIVPEFVAMKGTVESFTVFGINAPLNTYSSTILPVLVGIAIMALVEKGLKKIIPDMLSTVFVPFFTVLIMTPVMFCFAGPLGGWLGSALSNGLIAFATNGGFIAVAIIAAIWEYLVMSGMHSVVIMFAIINLFKGTPDSCIILAGSMATMATYGTALGAFIKIKNKEEKPLALSYFVSGFVGGVAEPTLYGICIKYKKPFIALSAGAFAGGIYAGLTHVTVHLLGATNVLTILGFVAGGTTNIVNGCIAAFGSFIIAAVLTIILGGFEEK